MKERESDRFGKREAAGNVKSYEQSTLAPGSERGKGIM